MTKTNGKIVFEWAVERWHGGFGCRAGFYVARTIAGKVEWLNNKSGRAKCFQAEVSALAVVESLNKRVNAGKVPTLETKC